MSGEREGERKAIIKLAETLIELSYESGSKRKLCLILNSLRKLLSPSFEVSLTIFQFVSTDFSSFSFQESKKCHFLLKLFAVGETGYPRGTHQPTHE